MFWFRDTIRYQTVGFFMHLQKWSLTDLLLLLPLFFFSLRSVLFPIYLIILEELMVMYSPVGTQHYRNARRPFIIQKYELYSLILSGEDAVYNYHSATYWWQIRPTITEMISLSDYGAQACFEYGLATVEQLQMIIKSYCMKFTQYVSLRPNERPFSWHYMMHNLIL